MPMPVGGRLGRSSPFWVDFDSDDGLDRNGLPIFRSGQIPTYARGGTVNTATSVDRRGRVHVAGGSTPRFSCAYDAASGLYVRRGLRLELQRKNLVTSPNDLSGTGWAESGTPTRVAAAKNAGSVVLDLLGDDAGATAEAKVQTLVFTGDGVKAITVAAAQSTSTSSVIRVYDPAAAADRLFGVLTWAEGLPVVTMDMGTYLGYERRQNGVFVLYFQTTAVTAANSNNLYLYPAEDLSTSGTRTGDVYLGGIQAEDARYPSSFIPQAASALTRNGDSFTIPFNATLQDFTVLLRASIPCSYGPSGYGNLLNIGANSDGVEIYVTNSSLVAEIRGTPNIQVAPVGITVGAIFTVVAQFANWGAAPVCRIDVGSGFSAWSAASNARTQLGAALLRLNAGSNGGAIADYQRLIVAPDSWTHDQLSSR